MNGNFELQTPRNRDGTFSPQLVKKRQTTMIDELEQKITALYGLGMSYNDIASHLEEMYEFQPAPLVQLLIKLLSKSGRPGRLQEFIQ